MDNLFLLLFFLSIVLYFVGLISPNKISKLFKRDLSRKSIALSSLALLVVSVIMIGVTTENDGKKAANLAVDDKNAPLASQSASSSEVIATNELETVVASTTEEKASQKQDKLYKVVYVVDGDTMDVNIEGKITRLRLIGIDTPETKDPRKPVQCFGQEASKQATSLLLGKNVRLEADNSQQELDKYGRLLRYIYREDGLFFNKWMIENGYAHEYTYGTPYRYQEEFKQMQQYAMNNKLGLWADDTCKGDTTQPVQTTTETKSTNPTSQIQPSDSATAPVTQPSPVQNNEQPSNETTEPSVQCLIKGNINSKGKKLYHLPGCPSYTQTDISESKGERWFCTEQEAINAGWMKAGNC